MSTETTTEPANELLTLIENSKVEVSTAQSLKAAFEGAFTQAKEWEAKAKTIKVTDASQLKEMKLARESRLLLRTVRTDLDKKRKELKSDALNYGRAVDGIATYLKELIEPTEAYLLEQEEFAKRIEEKRIEEMKQARISELTPMGVDVQYLDLAGMPEPVYAKLLADAKAAMEARHEEARKAAEAAQKAEADRIAAEKAEADRLELQRLENERLKREAEAAQAQIEKERAEMEAKLAEERRLAEVARKEAEAKAAAALRLAAEETAKATQKAEYERQVAEQRIREEQAKAQAERAAIEAKQRAEQAKRDAAIKAQQEAEAKKQAEERAKLEAQAAQERAAREKLEREAAAKRAAEEARVKAEQAAAKKAAKAPDKTKLQTFAADIRALKAPVLTTEEGKALQTTIAEQITKFAAWVDAQAAKL